MRKNKKRADVYCGMILLFRDVEIADCFVARFFGFMGRREPGSGGIHLSPCNGVHMFFMHFALDIVFLGEGGEVLKIIASLPIGDVSPVLREARSVLELPAGAAERAGLKVGEKLTFRPCCDA